MNHEVIENIRKLLSSNHIKEALKLLEQTLPDNSDIILLKGRYTELSYSTTITEEEGRVEMSKIGKSILSIIDSISNPDSVYNPIQSQDLNEVINTLRSIQKPYYYISTLLLLLGAGCLIYFWIDAHSLSELEILTSGLFTLSSGVPLSAALKKGETIKRANFFMRVPPPPSTSIQEAYKEFINNF